MSEKKNSTFAKNVRFIRKALGISEMGAPYSQTEFGEKMDVTKRSVVLWESGNVPNSSNLRKLAQLFSSMLGVDINANLLLKNDITDKVELLPRSDFEREFSPEHRKILRSLFLSAGSLNKTQLRKVVKYVDKIKKK